MNMIKKTEYYISHLENCFAKAEKGESKIDNDIIKMEGMTGTKTRHFYNNLLNMEDCRYLEIGTWKGSSVCAAMAGNKATVLCMDNWSEFSGPKDDFLKNYEKYKGNNKANFLEDDCFSIDISKIGKFNVYLYDGRHFDQDQRMALTYYIDAMDDLFIYIVDDWNWAALRNATMGAIGELKLNVLWNKQIITAEDAHDSENWWNGMGVFLLNKTV